MTLQWEPMALPGMLAGLAALVLATFVYMSRPSATQNRLLALMLLLGGLTIGGRYGARLLLESPSDAAALVLAGTPTTWLWAWAYVAFLGTIPSPLSRPFRGRWGRLAPGLVLLPPAIDVLVRGPELVRAVRPWQSFGGYRVSTEELYGALGIYLFLAVVVYGILVAVTAYLTARGAVTRKQTKHYMMAFVAQDTIFFLWFLPIAMGTASVTNLWLDRWNVIGLALGSFLFDILLVYGMLRSQLFGMELKLKFALKQGTVAAIFIAVFFIVSESAAQFLGERTGSAFLGIVAAGLLVFLIAPLQRLGERVSDTAMPHVHDTAEYRSRRAREIYQGALESSLVDSQVSAKERGLLLRLQKDLGLSGDEATELERDVLTQLGVA